MPEWKQFLSLARRRTESPEAYRQFQAHQGRRVLAALEAKGVEVSGKRALDLGCGLGGYTLALAECGAQVVPVDMVAAPLKALPPNFDPVCADACHLPFANDAFDFVFCASLIEHVPEPEVLLRQIRRVLAPGALCYLSFPPFYNPRGGHQFAPYHLLGERIAVWAYKRTRAKHLAAWQKDYVAEGRGYGDAYQGFGLHRMTLASAKRAIAGAGLEIAHLGMRYSPVNTARWPVLGEFLTWHAEFVLRKPS